MRQVKFKIAVVAGDALARLQVGVDRATLWNAFAADQFERIGLARHGDAPAAQAGAGSGQLAAKAILGPGPDTCAAIAGSCGKQPEFSRAGALAVRHRAAVADDGLHGLTDRLGQLPGRAGAGWGSLIRLRERRQRRDKAEKNDGDCCCKAVHNKTLVARDHTPYGDRIAAGPPDGDRPRLCIVSISECMTDITNGCPARYNRKSPFCVDLGGFASLAIGG